jgi:tetratricopeptide (TPR) repeat protein
MDEKIDPQVIPWTSIMMRSIRDAFHISADSSHISDILQNERGPQELQYLGGHLLRLREFKLAIPIIEEAFKKNAQDQRTLGMLINAYNMAGEPQKAIAPIEDWLILHPEDEYAKRLLNSLKRDSTRTD